MTKILLWVLMLFLLKSGVEAVGTNLPRLVCGASDHEAAAELSLAEAVIGLLAGAFLGSAFSSAASGLTGKRAEEAASGCRHLLVAAMACSLAGWAVGTWAGWQATASWVLASAIVLSAVTALLAADGSVRACAALAGAAVLGALTPALVLLFVGRGAAEGLTARLAGNAAGALVGVAALAATGRVRSGKVALAGLRSLCIHGGHGIRASLYGLFGLAQLALVNAFLGRSAAGCYGLLSAWYGVSSFATVGLAAYLQLLAAKEGPSVAARAGVRLGAPAALLQGALLCWFLESPTHALVLGLYGAADVVWCGCASILVGAGKPLAGVIRGAALSVGLALALTVGLLAAGAGLEGAVAGAVAHGLMQALVVFRAARSCWDGSPPVARAGAASYDWGKGFHGDTA
ncbi:MAG: hypothetical protein U0797_08165 [Gemmataceae bacterium]